MNKKVWDEILTRATTGMNLEDMYTAGDTQIYLGRQNRKVDLKRLIGVYKTTKARENTPG